jgi:hypothetical protein
MSQVAVVVHIDLQRQHHGWAQADPPQVEILHTRPIQLMTQLEVLHQVLQTPVAVAVRACRLQAPQLMVEMAVRELLHSDTSLR